MSIIPGTQVTFEDLRLLRTLANGKFRLECIAGPKTWLAFYRCRSHRADTCPPCVCLDIERYVSAADVLSRLDQLRFFDQEATRLHELSGSR